LAGESTPGERAITTACPQTRPLLAVTVGLLLVCVSCGESNRLSAHDFRLKANALCAKLNREGDSDLRPTKQRLATAIAHVEAGVTQLERLRPPKRDEARYTDFLARLRRTIAFTKLHEAQLLALEQAANHALPRRVADYGRKKPFAHFNKIYRRQEALLRPINHDIRLARRDARALGLRTCASGITGD
jgi:hypothetical protein